MARIRVNNKYTHQYCKALVIVHGASEYQIVRYVKSKLRLPLEIYSKCNGQNSIQINGLKSLLEKSGDFNKQKKFLKKYSNIQFSKEGLMHFKLFPIMDTDDCTDKTKEEYIDGTLFDGHWLKPYIISIYNSPALEDVLFDCKLIKKNLKNCDKTSTYQNLFPINRSSSNYDEIDELYNRLLKSKKTNFEEFIKYCLDWANENKL